MEGSLQDVFDCYNAGQVDLSDIQIVRWIIEICEG